MFGGIMMISEKLREMITPYLKIYLDKTDWKYIEDMFSEVYVTEENSMRIVTLKPTPKSDETAIQFSAVNGAYVSIDYWEKIKQRGKLL